MQNVGFLTVRLKCKQITFLLSKTFEYLKWNNLWSFSKAFVYVYNRKNTTDSKVFSHLVLNWAASWENRTFAQLISAFVFATQLIQSLFFLNPKFQVSGQLQWLPSSVCAGPGRKPWRPVFSERGPTVLWEINGTTVRAAKRYIAGCSNNM